MGIKLVDASRSQRTGFFAVVFGVCVWCRRPARPPEKLGRLNLFDLILIVLVVMAAAGGYRAGFVTRATSWVGLAVGIAVAVVVAPHLLDVLEQSADPQLRALIAVAILVLIASFGAMLGELAGVSLRRLIPLGPVRQVDRAAGAIGGALSVLVLLWLLLPALSGVPGDLSAQIRHSRIAQAVDGAAPNAPAPLQALRDLVQDANFPEVFEGLRPSPGGGAPPEGSALSPEVEQAVMPSTVRVTGAACDHVLEGSGFVAQPGVVVTNAHVIAGVDEPNVQTPGGRRLPARVTAFDPSRDLAVLEVSGLRAGPLSIAGAEVGGEAAVFGHPGGQIEVEVSPARIVQRLTAVGRDIYGSRTSRRDVLILAAALEPGDSGGAVVNTSGEVVGVAFAIAPDEPNTAYALNSTEIRAVLAERVDGSVDTGPCIR